MNGVRSLAARWQRFTDTDILYSFRRSWITVGAAIVTAMFFVAALFAPVLAPHNPYDLASLSLIDAFTPPAWHEDGSSKFLLGTDNQGRDVFSTIIYGSRASLLVGFASVLLAGVIGVLLGLISGYVGGMVDTAIMRVTEVQLSFPPILTALLIDGVLRGILPREAHDELAVYVIVLAIGFSGWPMYARTVRAVTMVEQSKEYVKAARITLVPSSVIMVRHVLPNAMGPVLVIATIYLAMAIILEATLSFLGVGIPPTEPSLGTLIRVGNDFLFSGEWWITIFPGVVLAILVLAVNLLGDWLRDALNPKLR
ncbi:MAG: ABC transporter permease [Gammaproteobacteria bacterium]|nr:ABC transporter permease [Gammaproteobacteria bacterium]